MNIDKYIFQLHGDSRGQLVAIEEYKDIPFKVKRIYYIYGTKENVIRGHHAHKVLRQMLICVHGSCKIHLDDGNETAEVTLDKANEGLYISSGVWREMYDFSPDAVLLVLASELYDETDYIRNYEQFVNGGAEPATNERILCRQ